MKRQVGRLVKIARKLAARQPRPDVFTALLEYMHTGKCPPRTTAETRMWVLRLHAAQCGRPDPHPHLASTTKED